MKPDDKHKLDTLLGQIDRRTLWDARHERQRPIIQERKELRPKGRPSSKDPGKAYVKINAAIPEDLRDQMKLALLTTFKGQYKTQDEVVEAAIKQFLDGAGG